MGSQEKDKLCPAGKKHRLGLKYINPKNLGANCNFLYI
jgi:hypothetical protein